MTKKIKPFLLTLLPLLAVSSVVFPILSSCSKADTNGDDTTTKYIVPFFEKTTNFNENITYKTEINTT
jgi:hypothetical protein